MNYKKNTLEKPKPKTKTNNSLSSYISTYISSYIDNYLNDDVAKKEKSHNKKRFNYFDIDNSLLISQEEQENSPKINTTKNITIKNNNLKNKPEEKYRFKTAYNNNKLNNARNIYFSDENYTTTPTLTEDDYYSHENTNRNSEKTLYYTPRTQYSEKDNSISLEEEIHYVGNYLKEGNNRINEYYSAYNKSSRPSSPSNVNVNQKNKVVEDNKKYNIRYDGKDYKERDDYNYKSDYRKNDDYKRRDVYSDDDYSDEYYSGRDEYSDKDGYKNRDNYKKKYDYDYGYKVEEDYRGREKYRKNTKENPIAGSIKSVEQSSKYSPSISDSIVVPRMPRHDSLNRLRGKSPARSINSPQLSIQSPTPSMANISPLPLDKSEITKPISMEETNNMKKSFFKNSITFFKRLTNSHTNDTKENVEANSKVYSPSLQRSPSIQSSIHDSNSPNLKPIKNKTSQPSLSLQNNMYNASLQRSPSIQSSVYDYNSVNPSYTKNKTSQLSVQNNVYNASLPRSPKIQNTIHNSNSPILNPIKNKTSQLSLSLQNNMYNASLQRSPSIQSSIRDSNSIINSPKNKPILIPLQNNVYNASLQRSPSIQSSIRDSNSTILNTPKIKANLQSPVFNQYQYQYLNVSSPINIPAPIQINYPNGKTTIYSSSVPTTASPQMMSSLVRSNSYSSPRNNPNPQMNEHRINPIDKIPKIFYYPAQDKSHLGDNDNRMNSLRRTQSNNEMNRIVNNGIPKAPSFVTKNNLYVQNYPLVRSNSYSTSRNNPRFQYSQYNEQKYNSIDGIPKSSYYPINNRDMLEDPIPKRNCSMNYLRRTQSAREGSRRNHNNPYEENDKQASASTVGTVYKNNLDVPSSGIVKRSNSRASNDSRVSKASGKPSPVINGSPQSMTTPIIAPNNSFANSSFVSTVVNSIPSSPLVKSPSILNDNINSPVPVTAFPFPLIPIVKKKSVDENFKTKTTMSGNSDTLINFNNNRKPISSPENHKSKGISKWLPFSIHKCNYDKNDQSINANINKLNPPNSPSNSKFNTNIYLRSPISRCSTIDSSFLSHSQGIVLNQNNESSNESSISNEYKNFKMANTTDNSSLNISFAARENDNSRYSNNHSHSSHSHNIDNESQSRGRSQKYNSYTNEVRSHNHNRRRSSSRDRNLGHGSNSGRNLSRSSSRGRNHSRSSSRDRSFRSSSSRSLSRSLSRDSRSSYSSSFSSSRSRSLSHDSSYSSSLSHSRSLSSTSSRSRSLSSSSSYSRISSSSSSSRSRGRSRSRSISRRTYRRSLSSYRKSRNRIHNYIYRNRESRSLCRVNSYTKPIEDFRKSYRNDYKDDRHHKRNSYNEDSISSESSYNEPNTKDSLTSHYEEINSVIENYE